MKGRTRWTPRRIEPVRNGWYECVVMFARSRFLWTLTWDGRGFVVPFSMRVIKWRGMTKKARDQAIKEIKK